MESNKSIPDNKDTLKNQHEETCDKLEEQESEIFLDNEDQESHVSLSTPSSNKKIFKNSFDKKKYSNITNDMRKNLIDAVDNKGEKIKHAAKRLGINYSSAKSICQVYKREGRMKKKSFKKRLMQNDSVNIYPQDPMYDVSNYQSSLENRQTQSSSTGKSDQNGNNKDSSSSNQINNESDNQVPDNTTKTNSGSNIIIPEISAPSMVQNSSQAQFMVASTPVSFNQPNQGLLQNGLTQIKDQSQGQNQLIVQQTLDNSNQNQTQPLILAPQSSLGTFQNGSNQQNGLNMPLQVINLPQAQPKILNYSQNGIQEQQKQQQQQQLQLQQPSQFQALSSQNNIIYPQSVVAQNTPNPQYVVVAPNATGHTQFPQVMTPQIYQQPQIITTQKQGVQPIYYVMQGNHQPVPMPQVQVVGYPNMGVSSQNIPQQQQKQQQQSTSQISQINQEEVKQQNTSNQNQNNAQQQQMQQIQVNHIAQPNIGIMTQETQNNQIGSIQPKIISNNFSTNGILYAQQPANLLGLNQMQGINLSGLQGVSIQQQQQPTNSPK